MRVFATVVVRHEGRVLPPTSLGHGALIGRVACAALQIDDVRVSEAHAMVSLRGGGLELLALRRRFDVDGKACAEVTLRPGLRIDLAPGVSLDVVDVHLPREVIGLAWRDRCEALLHDVATITLDPEPTVSWRTDPDAAAVLWRIGDRWRAAVGAAPAIDLDFGASFDVGGVPFTVVAVPLGATRVDETRSPADRLTLVAFFDTVHIHRRGCPVVVLAGQGARLISELATAGAPIGWVALARELWRDETDDDLLRNRLDAVLRRLRQKLVGEGIRGDLVAPDGIGHLELRLGPTDTVEDRT